jgi:catechol 2,3-dioxygenase-like lactoylglutathione lyase family enzyme
MEQLFYHVGIVVPDLDVAMTDYENSLGITFPEPRTTRVEQVYDGRTYDVEVRAVFSWEGPPYVELIEACDGVLGPDLVGLHHFGYAVDDIAQQLRVFRDAGQTIDATLGKGGSVAAFYIRSATTQGARIEFSTGSILR